MNQKSLFLYRTNSLTWHNGGIPNEEIWVKVGGDKGGSSFKMSFQVANVGRPNSPKNTFVFCVFQAPDTANNLHLALERYRSEIQDIQRSMWK